MGLGERTRLAVGVGMRRSARPRQVGGAQGASEIAWLALLPCALVTVALMLVLGPPLGDLLPATHVTPWPIARELFRPEPTEHARYLLALLGPLLLSAAIVLASRARIELGPSAARWIIALQALGVAVLAGCIAAQYATTFHPPYVNSPRELSQHTVYFSVATLVAACALAAAIAAGIHDRRVAMRAAALLRESPGRRAAAWSLAIVAIAISVLPAINTEHTIMNAAADTRYHLAFPLDETYAVLDGRSPLVDFAAQYGSLWPYLLGGVMRVVGDSVGTFTVLTSLLTALALLSVFAVLRRVLPTALAALALFLPLLATSLYMMDGTSANRYSLVTLLGAFPLRLAGPCFVLLLVARHLGGARPRSRVPLFTAAGLTILNNGDFGVPALGATVAALLWTSPLSVRSLARLAAEAVAGLTAAFAVVALLTLLRAGELPHLGLLVRYARLFAAAGFGLMPMKPLIGVSTIIYLTYVAAIGAATVRAVGREPDRLLTGLLAWSGAFGLGVGAYYLGRSHPQVLTNMFPAWALALTLLFALAVRTIAARPSRLPTPAEAACLVGFGVLACSLAQLPAPWTQATRLEQTTSRTLFRPAAERFLAAQTRPGEPVVILSELGHRLAFKIGVRDVAPYTGEESIPAREQLMETLAALRRAGGHKVFVPLTEPAPEIHETIETLGFRVVTYDAGAGLAEFTSGG